MTVWTAGGPVPGVISRKAIHLLTEEERKQVVKLKDMWLDIGAKDKAEAEGLVQHRRSGHAAAWLSGDAEQLRQFAGAWTTNAACGSASKRCAAPVRRS